MNSNIAQPTQPSIAPVVQAPVTQSVQSIPSNPSSKTKHILLAALILLILLAVGGGIYYLGVMKQQSNSEKNTRLTTITPSSNPKTTPVQLPTLTASETATWKNYNLSDAHISFSLPQGWIDNGEPSGPGWTAYSHIFFTNPAPTNDSSIAQELTIELIATNKTFQEMVNYYKTENYGSPVDEIIIVDGKTCLFQSNLVPVGYNGNTLVSSSDCLANNLDYTITFSSINQEKNDLLFKKILSTVKFTGQNQTGCNTDSDCQNGAKCMTVGPIIANQPIQKVCVQQGQAVPQ